ncbi:MAG TPA: hypothetical protein VEB21_09405 [Terriglobales bacterium]|nr:hypothetical protein [Terriglobales bacterium]
MDPLGLYQIADQLAVQLVPAVRERMQRVRFLTAMAVGALVTEGIDDDVRQRDASPYLVWEWLIIEAFIQEMGDSDGLAGTPGTLVARRALGQHGYLDARSYLKTPRIFGFHGVYKRLAIHLGLVDVHLRAGPNAEPLVNAWARDRGLSGYQDAQSLLSQWAAVVRGCLAEAPPRTKLGRAAATKLAEAFAPGAAGFREKRCLRELLKAEDDRRLGALPVLWQLQSELGDDEFCEELLHDELERREPVYGQLLRAIRAYEKFARSLQDAFDVLKAVAATSDGQGSALNAVARDPEFKQSMTGLHERFEQAHRALGEVGFAKLSLQNLFHTRFIAFADPLSAGDCAAALCDHHVAVQRGKSADGKRPWFDRIGRDRIYIRLAYRQPRRAIQPDRYVHDYRGWPIRRFHGDLT